MGRNAYANGGPQPTCVTRAPAKLPLGERTLIMGVVNVTPDSFSDGGDFALPEAAAAHARLLAQQGADLLDIGGESTRPGSKGISLEEELRRVLPVVERAARDLKVLISVDTTKAEVARRCLAAGALMVNDVSAGRLDPGVIDAARDAGAYLVLMHMKGTPREMQLSPSYQNVVGEVSQFLKERAGYAESRGIPRGRIIVDPGIGFGKSLEHNMALLCAVPQLKALGYPLLVGASRKSMFKALLGIEEPKARDGATASLTSILAAAGVDIVRVHEVPRNLEAARLGDKFRARR
jgi:dihydropteroate synthase